jgi:hypothetical protein
MPILNTTAWGTASNDPTVPAVKPKTQTGFVEGIKATWDQESIWVPSKVRPSLEYPDDHSFDFRTYDKMYWPLVSVARNKEHADDLVKQYTKEQENKAIMDNQSFITGLGTNFLVGLTNPLNYIGVGKAATLSMAAVKGSAGAVLGTALTEPILHSNQVSRTWEESALNIGGAAVVGAPLGATGKAISNKLGNAALDKMLADEGLSLLPRTPGGSVGAAAATQRTMADAKLASIPFIPKSWTEPIARFSLPFTKSANQRLGTSEFLSVRNAQNTLLRTGMATEQNAAGVANQVPIEVAVGQRAGDLYTQLIEADKNLRDAWFKKVEGGTYDSQIIIAALKAQDASLPDNYKLTRNSFDRVMKLYMADDTSLGNTMPEVVQRVQKGADVRAKLDADKIDFGLADKKELIDLATGQRVVDPTKAADGIAVKLTSLQTRIKNLEAEIATSADGGKATFAKTEKHKSLEAKIAELQTKSKTLESNAATAATPVASSEVKLTPKQIGEHSAAATKLEAFKVSNGINAEAAAIVSELGPDHPIMVAADKIPGSRQFGKDTPLENWLVSREQADQLYGRAVTDDEHFAINQVVRNRLQGADSAAKKAIELEASRVKAQEQGFYTDYTLDDYMKEYGYKNKKLSAKEQKTIREIYNDPRMISAIALHMHDDTTKLPKSVVVEIAEKNKVDISNENFQTAIGKIAQERTYAPWLTKPKSATTPSAVKPTVAASVVDSPELTALRAEIATVEKELAGTPLQQIPGKLDDLEVLRKEYANASAAVEKAKADFENLQPSSTTHKFAYEDGSHYLSRTFDKGRIMGDREGFKQALIKGWEARNPGTATDVGDLEHYAERVVNKLLNEDATVTLGDLKKNLDLPGEYTKGRTLNIDDRFIVNYTHDDVLATELHHISQAVVDIELAKAGVSFNDLAQQIQTEFEQRVAAINTQYGVNSTKAANKISELSRELAKDRAELDFAMRRLKRQAPDVRDPTMQTLNEWTSRVKSVAGMAQLGSSALPNSLGDVASVARNFGTGRTYKIIAQAFSSDFRKDIAANAKQMGVLSTLVDRAVREGQLGDELANSMNPNKGFKSPATQMLDRGLEHTQDVFAKVSLIDGWSRVGRTIASAASTQHILDAAAKGWDNLSSTTRTDLAKFYIDKAMLERIAKQAALHADDVDGVKFAGLEKWTDDEAIRIFRSSVYAHTEHALNIPSIGSGSKFMTENFIGRLYNGYKAFNNQAHESTFLSSLQNREFSRVVTGTLNYAFWGFASLYAYDTISGRNTSMDHYFGDTDKATLTGWKILAKTGYVATAQDAFVTMSKLAGSKINPLRDEARQLFPESLEKEIFPKYEAISPVEKLLGPAYGYGSQVIKAATGVADGDVTDKDIHAIRGAIPFQNIGWLRRGLDYVEEALGGLPADRNLNK